MNHASQRASFPLSAEETQAPEECLFCLMITPSACYLLKLSPVRSEESLSAPERWEMILHSWWSPASSLPRHRVNHLGEIFSARRDRRTAWHIFNGEFNNLKSARSSMSKKKLERERRVKHWCSSKERRHARTRGSCCFGLRTRWHKVNRTSCEVSIKGQVDPKNKAFYCDPCLSGIT